MACVTACPSGVQYDRLLESVRPQIERNVDARPGRPAVPRGDLRAVPLQAAAAGGGRARGALPEAARDARRSGALAERAAGPARRRWSRCCRRCRVRDAFARLPERTPAVGAAARDGSRCSPAACRTCSSTGSTRPPCGCSPPRAATSLVPRDQQCCGALELHAGREDRRAGPRPARRSPVRARSGVDHVVANVAGCGSSMKEYGHLLADDPEWARAGEGVQRAGPRRPRGARRPARRRRPARPAAPGPRPGRLPRRLPPRARPGRARPAARRAAHDPGRWRSSTSPRPRCAAARPGSTTWSRRRPAAELGARKAANIRVGAAGHRGHREPGLPAADRQAPCRAGLDGDTPDGRTPQACRCCTRSSCSTPRSAGCRSRVPDGSASRAAENVGGRR